MTPLEIMIRAARTPKSWTTSRSAPVQPAMPGGRAGTASRPDAAQAVSTRRWLPARAATIHTVALPDRRALHLDASPTVHFDPLNAGLFIEAAAACWARVGRQRRSAGRDSTSIVRLLDMGCGSGVWGLILHRLAPPSVTVRVTFADVDTCAVQLAARNAAANGVPEGSYMAVKSDMFSAIPLDEPPFDLITFNPPQTGGSEAFCRARLDKYGGSDGSLYHRRFATESPPYLQLGADKERRGAVAIAHIGLAAPTRVQEHFGAAGFQLEVVAEQQREFHRDEMEDIHPGLFDWQLAVRVHNLHIARPIALYCASVASRPLVSLPMTVHL